ncbi:MAG TPA: DUF1839 family protein [Pirellulales bacterium]|jgi:hypothetical protein|nr:DUF1839 family protein [Pirellulales bacterium]
MKRHVLALDPATYQRHRIHTQERHWAETNCYVDVWVELLHAWGFEPLAAAPFTVAIDFEGDQWTFFKFPLADLAELYGLDVQELAIWRPLVGHVEEQIGLGRPVLVELDSFYLPDTAGTAYQLAHVKSTVAAVEIDVAERRLGYFHGQGYYELLGDDFANVFRLNGAGPDVLPPYTEFVKRRSGEALSREALVETSLRLLWRQLDLLPEANPFAKFKPRFAADMDWLAHEPLEVFHQYSFATLRQFGACYELAATYLGWLMANDVPGLDESMHAFSALSSGAKTMQFQLARAMARKKPLDLSPLDEMARTWASAIDGLLAQTSRDR